MIFHSHINSTLPTVPTCNKREEKNDFFHPHNTGNSIQSLDSFLNFHEVSCSGVEEVEVGKRIWLSSGEIAKRLQFKCQYSLTYFLIPSPPQKKLVYIIGLDNDQIDTHFLYFTISPLHSSTCFKHYMLIIRGLIALMQHLVSSSQSVAVRCTG